MYIVPFHFG